MSALLKIDQSSTWILHIIRYTWYKQLCSSFYQLVLYLERTLNQSRVTSWDSFTVGFKYNDSQVDMFKA